MRSRAIALSSLILTLAIVLAAYAAAPTLDATIRTWTFDDVGANGGTVSGSAACPAGERATGGGIYPVGANPGGRRDYLTILSGPLDETGTTASTETGDVARRWFTSIRNGMTAAQDVKGFALCSKNSDVTVVAKTVTGQAMGDKPTETVMCPAGQRAVGGGVNTPTGPTPRPGNPDWEMDFNGPVDSTGTQIGTETGDVPRGWTAAILNGTGATQSVKFFAMCSAFSDAVLVTKAVQTSNSGGAAAGVAVSTVARCPDGFHVTGGGVLAVGGGIAAGEVQFSGPYSAAGSPSATTDGEVGRAWLGGAGNQGAASYRVAAVCEGDDTAVPTPTPTATPDGTTTPEPTTTATPDPPQLEVSVTPQTVKRSKSTKMRFIVEADGEPVAAVRIAIKAHESQLTGVKGIARATLKFNRKGTFNVTARKDGFAPGKTTIKVKKR